MKKVDKWYQYFKKCRDILLGNFNVLWFNDFPPPVMVSLSSDVKKLSTLYLKNKKNTVTNLSILLRGSE